MKLLVSGANGFVGRAVCQRLLERGLAVRGAVRSEDRQVPAGVEKVVVGDAEAPRDLGAALAGVFAVVHTVARVHRMRDRSTDPLAAHRAVNVEGTLRLARAAAAAGVRRFVFMSSVKVNGEGRRAAFTENDAPAPADPYGVSKWEAEQALATLGRETGLEVAVLRPPLVYGPGVRANFLRLLDLVARGVPLPLGAVHNRRSLIFVGNLADAAVAAATSPGAAGRTFLVSDGQDLSTPDLVRAMAAALRRRAHLLPVPERLLRLAAALVGGSDAADRLLGSLWVDSAPIRRDLGWSPPFSVAEGLAATASWYASSRH